MIKKPQNINRFKAFNDDAVLPLINIVFLLLIFFIVMGKFYHADLKKTQLAKIDAGDKLNHNSMFVMIDKNSDIFVNGNKTKLNQIKVDKNKTITISIDRRALATKFINTLNHFKNKGAKSVDIAVKPYDGGQ